MVYIYTAFTTFGRNCQFSYWCSRLLVLFGITVLNNNFIAIIIGFSGNLFRYDNSKMASYHNGMLVNISADELFEKLHCVNNCNYVTIVLIGAIQLVSHYYCIDYKSNLLVSQVFLNKLNRSYNYTEQTMFSKERILCNHIDYDECVIELSDDDDDDDDKKKIPMSVQSSRIDITCSIDQSISFNHKYDIEEQWKSFLKNEHNINQFANKMRIGIKTLNHLLYNNFKPVITYKNTLDTIYLDEKKKMYYDTYKQNTMDIAKDEDVMAVNETIYTAPVDLSKIGNLKYPILKKRQVIYAKDINSLHSWLKCEVINVVNGNFALVKFDVYEKLMTTKLIAYFEPSPILFPVGTRVIAVLNNTTSTTNNNFCAGFIGEPPKLLNKFRYMIFFDNNCVQYCHHTDIRLIANKTNEIPVDMDSDDQEFIQNYLANYPDRKMLKLAQNKFLRAKHKDLWQSSKVLEVDASLVKLFFLDTKESDWLYRGSLRLYKIFIKIFPEKVILQSGIVNIELNKQCNENKNDKQKSSFVVNNRNVARKRTNKIPMTFGKKNKKHSQYNKSIIVNSISSSDMSTELGKDDKRDNTLLSNNYALRPKKFVIHNCNRNCIGWTSYSFHKAMKISMLVIPLNFGFVRYWATIGCDEYVLYKTPCGRTIRNIQEMYNYLLATESEMTIDYFDFDVCINPLAGYKLPFSYIFVLDMSFGKECIPITCVNEINNEEPPEMHYMTTRQPMKGVSMNVESDFLCGCDCTDNCANKSRCACWKMTINEGQRFLRDCHKNLNIGYKYRRLSEKVFTGIYECNSKCHCSSSCLNRVVQYPISQRLQLFRTEKKGWGVRCLNDIAQGSFICNYVGNLLTEYDANQDGKQFGDEYLAELDYIDTLETFKEDYEDSIPESDQENYNTTNNNDESGIISISSDEEFQYIYEGNPQSFQKSKKCKTVIKKTNNYEKFAHITSRLNNTHHIKKINYDFPKSLRKYFGNNESVYVMDAKVSGNIGRYLNHSCSPNIFVQNVFVETHDPRFPWLSFFACKNIEAGTELSWDYNYFIGSVPGKILECYCNSDNCKGRLL